MEDTARVHLIQQIVAVFSASVEAHSDVQATAAADPHVLYAQHIHRQLEGLQIADDQRIVVQRFESALKDVLLRFATDIVAFIVVNSS